MHGPAEVGELLLVRLCGQHWRVHHFNRTQYRDHNLSQLIDINWDNMFRPIRLSSRLSVLHPVRWNSTASPAMPPLMATFRQDLKDAMRAKNTPKYV